MGLIVFNGNWVDFAIILIVFLYLLSGWGRGLLFGFLDLLGFIVSFIAALKFYVPAGKFLMDNFSLTRGISNAFGFFIAGILSELIYSLLVNFSVKEFYSNIKVFINNKRKIEMLKNLDNWLGAIPSIGESIIFITFILTLLVTLPIQGNIKKDIVTSRLGGPLVKSAQGIESQLNNVFGDAVTETLTFLTVNPNPVSQESVDLGFIQREGVADSHAENTMLTLVNIERQKHDLPPLKSSSQLKKLARDYARTMFENGFFSHYDHNGNSPFERMENEGIKFLAAGENLALAPNVTLAHQGLMNSPGHRANILSADFGQIGIGVIDGGIYGSLFVQEFTN